VSAHTKILRERGGRGGHQPTDNLIHTVGLSVHPGAFNKISYISFCQAEHPNKDLLGVQPMQFCLSAILGLSMKYLFFFSSPHST